MAIPNVPPISGTEETNMSFFLFFLSLIDILYLAIIIAIRIKYTWRFGKEKDTPSYVLTELVLELCALCLLVFFFESIFSFSI